MFENVKTLSELKKEYRVLALQYHPDCGGSDELMKQLNLKYETLFPIFKRKENNTSNETASSTRSEFYTQNGWKGENYNSSLSLKEIANIVRAYVKSVYPEFKFSITTHYASMRQSLSVVIVQGDCEAYKKPNEWTQEENQEANYQILRWKEYHFSDEEIEKNKQKLFMTERMKALKEDVDCFVNSYNWHDCDGMIDYFDVNFYYTGGASIGTYNKPYTVKEFKGKKDSGVTYEPVKETRTKIKKYKKAETFQKSDDWKVGDCFIVCVRFTGGIYKNAVYQIKEINNSIVKAVKFDRRLSKLCEAYQRGNHWYSDSEKFFKWVESGALKPCRIVDAEKVEEYEVTTFKAKRETKPATRKAEPKKHEQATEEKPQPKTAAERMEEVRRKNAELKAQREAKKAQEQQKPKDKNNSLSKDERLEAIKKKNAELKAQREKAKQEQSQSTAKHKPEAQPEQEEQPENSVFNSVNDEPLQEKENALERKKQALQTAQQIEQIAVDIMSADSFTYTQAQRQWHTPQFKELLKEKLQPSKDSLNNLVIECIAFDELKKIVQSCMNDLKDMEENNNV